MKRKLLFVFAVVASAALTAQANFVTNGGFETGNFSGWTQFGDTAFSGVNTQSPQASFPPHSGSYLADFGPLNDGGIRQTLTGGAGTYQLDFWLAADDGGASDYINVTLGGTTVYTQTGTGTFNFIHIITAPILTGANPELVFHFTNVPAFWDLDDVNVDQVNVPVPDSGGTLGLFALGVLGLMAATPRRHLV